MLKLYNSLTKKQEEIKIDQDDVRVYLCGQTVQSSPHLGHGRSAVVFDFFIRYLKYLNCLLYTSPSPRDKTVSRMPSSA